MKGVDLYLVKELLGHASIEMTERLRTPSTQCEEGGCGEAEV